VKAEAVRTLLAALAIPLLFAAGAGASATEDVGSLLRDLGLAAPAKKEGRVQVLARIERRDGGAMLVVDFLPEGDAKLVADPGITVVAVDADGVRWPAGTEARAVLPGTSYFETPPEVRLPVEAGAGTLVEADVDYAWCLVGWQCLFGNERVRVVVPEPPGEPTG
jgi:hypothetical protein